MSRLSQADVTARPILLDLRKCTFVDASAGWRIANALRPHGGRGPITAVVPGVASTKGFTGPWFRTLTRSGLGYALAQRADTIISNQVDVTELVREYYREHMREESQNLAFVRDLTAEGSINIDRLEKFLPRFRRLLHWVNVDAGASRTVNVDALAKLCFEAAQNVRDHAGRSPLAASTRVCSYLSLQYHKSLTRTGRTGAADDDFLGYFDRVTARAEETDLGFVEVVVNDDGAGLAARQTQASAIYEGALEAEQRAVQEVLRAGVSVKLRVNDSTVRGDPGYGFTHIVHNLRELQAFATLRTGRLLMVFDGTTDASSFQFSPQELGYLPGTVLDVIFPKPSSQLRLPSS